MIIRQAHGDARIAAHFRGQARRVAALIVRGVVAALIMCGLITGSAAMARTACQVPANLPPAQVETPPPGQIRNVPVTSYLLAMTWSPQFCRENRAPRNASQCDQDFGFILHGLWPEGVGRNWPQWCAPAAPLPEPVIRANFCASPSVSLLQHEWAKHGTCMTNDPAAYFKTGTTLFSAVGFPDMNALSRSRPTVGAFKAALARANPGLRADMFVIETSRGGWLEEIRLCLNKSLNTQRCPRGIGGAADRDRLKIWRSTS